MIGKAVALVVILALQSSVRAASPPADVAEATSTPPMTPGMTAGRIGGYLLVAGGLVTVTVGGLLAYGGASQASEANIRLANARTPAEWDRSKVDFDAGERRNRKGWVLTGVGAAGVAAGVLLITLLPAGTAPETALGPWLTGDAGGLVLARAW